MLDKREQELIAKNLNEVSFYFFFIVGLTHIVSGLLFANQFFTPTTWLINRLLDIPFLWVTLIYLYSNAKLYLIKSNQLSHTYDLVLVTSIIMIGLAAFLADLIFSNQLPI
jgi:hypothetical protein